MKTRILLTLAFFLAVNFGFAQNEECMTQLSIMREYAKAKNYDAAYEPFMKLRKDCPKYNLAIYSDGEKILTHKIKNSNGADKTAFINDLEKMWGERAQYFITKTPKGKYGAKAAQLMYDNRQALGKSDEELYKTFDEVYKADKANFKSAKSILTYFKLMVKLFDAGKQPAQALFNKYDDMVEKIEEEVKDNSTKLNKLIAKEDAGQTLTKKEGKYKKYHGQMLTAFDKISGSIDTELGNRANCENLIPLYSKDFEANKNNAEWLQRAAGKMSAKDCTGDPLFFKLVNAYHNLSPSANSAYYLGLLKDKEGKSSEAVTYYEQAISLETDNFKKAKLYERIASKLKKSGRYGKARNYYRQSLKLNPSNGRPHIAIASMYASSANSCGDSNFNKRAVFWLAAQEARKAGRVDPTLKKAGAQSAASYEAKAPSKSEIFSANMSGKTVKVGCWIGASVKVPSI